MANTPNPNFNGIDSFIYRADNGSNFIATATVTLTVTPVNDAPIAVNDTGSTSVGTPVTLSVLLNDSDPEGDPIVLTGVSNYTGGVFEVTMDTAAGTVTFIPSSGGNQLPPGSYSAKLSDVTGAGGTAIVEVYEVP